MKRLSFDNLIENSGTKFATIETADGEIVIGSLCSADILEWMDENEDPARNKFSGLRMLLKSIIQPDGKRLGEGLPESERLALHDASLEKLKRRDSIENGKLVRECLKLNGLRSDKATADAAAAAIKNV